MNGLLSLGTIKLGSWQKITWRKKPGVLGEKLLVPKIQLQEKPRLSDAAFL